MKKVALDSGHGVSDISSFIVNGSKLKANPWEFITVQNPEPCDFFFSELAIDELSRAFGIRAETEGFGPDDAVDLTGALAFESTA